MWELSSQWFCSKSIWATQADSGSYCWAGILVPPTTRCRPWTSVFSSIKWDNDSTYLMVCCKDLIGCNAPFSHGGFHFSECHDHTPCRLAHFSLIRHFYLPLTPHSQSISKVCQFCFPNKSCTWPLPISCTSLLPASTFSALSLLYTQSEGACETLQSDPDPPLLSLSGGFSSGSE